MKKDKLVIEVKGGIVQNIYSNLDLDVTILDYDNLEDVQELTNQEVEEFKEGLKEIY